MRQPRRRRKEQTVVTVPDELLPAIRKLLATHKSAKHVEVEAASGQS